MDKYLIIAVGAVTGAFCRFWLGSWTADKWGTHFVTGTLLINLLGSFALGLFLTLHLDRGLFTPNARYLVAVGWCASFTTYSTFSWDTFKYIQEGNFKLAALNVGLTLLGCLFATWAGAATGKLL